MSSYVNASFLITEGCNLHCPYCFEPKKTGKTMSDEIIRQGIKFLLEEAKDQPVNKPISILLFGGEPFLHTDKVKTFFENCYELRREYHRPIQVNCSTNATLMNDELYMILRRAVTLLDFNVQLSIDGIPEVQNKQRPSPSFDSSCLIEAVVPIYKKLFNAYPSKLTIHACIHPDTVNLTYKNYRYFKDVLGINAVWFLPIVTSGKNEWTDSQIEEYRKQMYMILDDILSNPETAMADLHLFTPFSNAFSAGSPDRALCGSGLSFLSITADGSIYPCHHYYFNDSRHETKVGDIWSGLDYDKCAIFREAVTNNKCENCPHTTCYRCAAQNFETTGSMFKIPSEQYCKLMLIDKEIQDKIRQSLVPCGCSHHKENAYAQLRHMVF